MVDVLVTGGSGFIGRHLIKRLQLAGKSVLCLSSRDGDIAEYSTWKDLPTARVVIHLAGKTYVPNSWSNSAEFLRVNVIGAEHAIAYCEKTGANLVMASGYLYGIPDQLPITEKLVPRPNNPYALSKYIAEQLGQFYSNYHGLSITILRIFNVYGPGQNKEFLIPKIINQIKSESQIRLNSLTPRRDYVYIDDVIDAIESAIKLKEGFNTINIGSGISYSVKEIVDIIQSVAASDLPIISDGVDRPQEIFDVYADISIANKILNWKPKHSLASGVVNIISEDG